MSRKTVAMVVPSLDGGGGVPGVARFLCNVIGQSDLFEYKLFSVPSSSVDSASVRLRSPTSWSQGPVVKEGHWEGRTYEHVGAVAAELEFQRYRPRPPLTRRLAQCDVVQVVCGSPAWGLVAGQAGRPVALQVATLAGKEREERFRQEEGLATSWRRIMTRITECLDRRAAQAADLIFVENDWMEEALKRWASPGKVVLAPPGVDTNLFCPSSSPPGSGEGYLVSVGRFGDPRKNVRLLFEAYSYLKDHCENTPELILVGESPPPDEDWARARELGIREHLQFHQGVSRDRLAELYRNASIFVLSSSEEGLGLVILEAMASGLPVVSTATAGAQEAVEESVTGILTPIRDAEGLGKAVGRLLEDGELRFEMGRKGRLRAEERYSTEAAGARFLAGYRKLLGVEEREFEDS